MGYRRGGKARRADGEQGSAEIGLVVGRRCDAGTYHVDEYVEWSTIPLLNQLCSIMVRPLRLIIQIPRKRLLSPRAFAGVGDGGVGGHGFVFPGVFEELVISQQRIFYCNDICIPMSRHHVRPCCARRC